MPTVPGTDAAPEPTPTAAPALPSANEAFGEPALPSADEAFGPAPLPTADEAFGPAPEAAAEPKPPTIPTALLDRVARGAVAWAKINKAAKDGFAHGFGSSEVGLSPENEKKLQDLGVFNLPGEASPLRAFNESLLKPATVLTDGFVRALTGVVGGASAAFGSGVESATGDETQGKQAAREMENFINYLMLSEGQIVTRVERGPTGVLHDVQVGRLPTPEDFPIAAQQFGGTRADPVIKRLYEEKGIMPAEVVHDAQFDVTISQDIAAGRVPQVYGGGKLAPVEGELPKAGLNDLQPSAGGGSGGGGKPPEGSGALPGGSQKALPGPGAERSFEEMQSAIMDSINVGQHDVARPMTWDRLYTAAVDDLNPVAAAERKALAEAGIKEPLPTSESPYDLFRLSRGTFGKADQMLVNGTFDFNSYATNGQSLQAALAPVSKNLDGFRAYVTSRRVVELEARGVESGFDLAAAKGVVEKNPDKALFEKAHRELVDYQNRVTRYLRDSGVINDQAYKVMLEANKDYVPFYRYMDPDLVGLGPKNAGARLSSRNPIKRIEGSELGITDPIESIIKNTYTYIALAEKNAAGVKLVDLLKAADEGRSYASPLTPWERAAAEAKPTKPAGPAIEGPKPVLLEGEVIPPGRIETSWKSGELLPPDKSVRSGPPAIERVHDLPGSPEAVIIDAEFSIGTGNEQLFANVTNASRVPEGETISVFRNGRRETYKVNDPDLLDAWRGMDAQTAGFFQKILAAPARTLRAGATLSPDFIARNVIRDFFSAVVNTKGGIFTPIDTTKGAIGILRKDQDFQNWLKGGGANSALVSMDRQYLQENLFKLNQDTGLGTRMWNVTTSPLTALRMTSELIENATRLGEFKKVAGGATDKAAIQAGAFASREVTLDFARIGAQMRGYNMITAFANAQIQGIDRIARAFRDNPYGTTAKALGGVTAPSVLLWWANHDDPRYKEIPRWQKDLAWVIITDKWEPATAGDAMKVPEHMRRQIAGDKGWEINNGSIYRIPKPFEVGLVFGSGVERALDKWADDNPEAFREFGKSMVAAMTPAAVPTAAVPFVEQFANKSLLLGGPIVPSRLEKQLPEYQYTEYTTETAKALGRLIGAFPGMRDTAIDPSAAFHGVAQTLTSPAQLENFVRNWTGGLGAYALKITDTSLQAAGVLPDPPKPLSTLADIPFVKAFVVRYPSASAQSVQDFYDRNATNKSIMDTFQAQAKMGDAEAAQLIMDTYGPRIKLDGIQQTIGLLSQTIRNTYRNPDMSPSDKRQLIDSLYYSMIQVAQGGNETLKAIEKQAEERRKAALPKP